MPEIVTFEQINDRFISKQIDMLWICHPTFKFLSLFQRIITLAQLWKKSIWISTVCGYSKWKIKFFSLTEWMLSFLWNSKVTSRFKVCFPLAHTEKLIKKKIFLQFLFVMKRKKCVTCFFSSSHTVNISYIKNLYFVTWTMFETENTLNTFFNFNFSGSLNMFLWHSVCN